MKENSQVLQKQIDTYLKQKEEEEIKMEAVEIRKMKTE